MLNSIGTNRERFLDFLRGFSILGILVVNLPILAEPQYGLSPFKGFVSEFAKWFIAFFFTGKFFILFSFVFGYGFSILIQSLENKDLDSKKVFHRRLLGLGTLGLIHAIFLFEGDILFSYSILGFFLYKLKDKPIETLKKYILIFWILSFVANASIGAIGYYLKHMDEKILIEFTNQSIKNHLGDLLTVTIQRTSDLIISFPVIILFNWSSAFMMFLVGMFAGKNKLFNNPEKILESVHGKKFWIFLIALVSNTIYSFSHQLTYSLFLSILSSMMLSIAGISLGFIYVLILIQIHKRNTKENFIIQMVCNVGSMSMSNYLSHSIICGVIFNGWGFGKFSKVSPELVLAIAALIYIFNLIFSTAWKKFNSIGPFEWLLRKWTYRNI